VDVKWPAPKTVSRENPNGLDTWALAAVFRAGTAKLPAYAGLGVGQQGYAILRISQVIEASGIDAQKLAESEFGLARQEARADFQDLLAGLRARTKIEINQENVERPQGG
jgi:peptidyl-prolyl cis-trans isomerase D